MSYQQPQHRRHRATVRIGAALAIPALVAAAIYAVASDRPDSRRAGDDADTITFAPVDPTVDPIATPTPSSTPTRSTPTDDPTGTETPEATPSATPEPDPSPSQPDVDRDEERSPGPTPGPTYTYSPPPDDDPPDEEPPDDDPPDEDPPEDDAPPSVRDLLAELQDHRASAGCAPLEVNSSLMTAAQEHSENRDEDPGDLAEDAGYDGEIDNFTTYSALDDTPHLDDRELREVADCRNDHVGIGTSGMLIARWSVILGDPDRRG